MKKLNSLLFFFSLALVFSCSKDDPSPSACTFTFKNKSYSANDVLCDDVPSGTTMTTYGQVDNELWHLTLGADFGVGAIWLNLNSVDFFLEPGASYTADFTDNTYTFSGILYNDDDETDFAEISGICTCTREQ